MKIISKIIVFFTILLSNLFIIQYNAYAETISTNTTINTDTTYDSLIIQNWATLTLNAKLTVTWDATIQDGWVLTHSLWATTNFFLQVNWTLDINSWAQINMNEKWNSTTWTHNYWTAHWGISPYTSNSYWDIFNPSLVGSRSYWSMYWGGLVKVTAWNLINNWSISANWRSYNSSSYWNWSWGSINIIVNWNISWNWSFLANWGDNWYNDNYCWAGWRIAIKYNSVTDLNSLKNNISAVWPGYAWEGTIYLKNLSSWEDYLLIKGDWKAYNTHVWTGYNDYYFDTIEITNWAKFYISWTETIAAQNCVLWWDPVWIIDPNISCDWTVGFKYYDLITNISNFSIKERKYEYIIQWPDWWATMMNSATWTINWNWVLSNRIKLSRLWTYKFVINIYNWTSEDATIEASDTMNLIVSP